jgi:hypothetical protein
MKPISEMTLDEVRLELAMLAMIDPRDEMSDEDGSAALVRWEQLNERKSELKKERNKTMTNIKYEGDLFGAMLDARYHYEWGCNPDGNELRPFSKELTDYCSRVDQAEEAYKKAFDEWVDAGRPF